MDIEALIASAKLDPTLSSLPRKKGASDTDIDRLLDHLETAKTDFLENKSWSIVHQDTFLAVKSLQLTEQVTQRHCAKLAAYRFVDEIHQLHRGKFARWIRLDDPSAMTAGGIAAEIKFTDSGIHVICRLYNGRYVQYAFDECLTFQKLTPDESMILSLYAQLEEPI